jgi:hypothetical protein
MAHRQQQVEPIACWPGRQDLAVDHVSLAQLKPSSKEA